MDANDNERGSSYIVENKNLENQWPKWALKSNRHVLDDAEFLM